MAFLNLEVAAYSGLVVAFRFLNQAVIPSVPVEYGLFACEVLGMWRRCGQVVKQKVLGYEYERIRAAGCDIEEASSGSAVGDPYDPCRLED